MIGRRNATLVSPTRVTLRTLLVRLGFALGRLLPVRRHVVLATAHASAISGNLAWIREEMQARGLGGRVTVMASGLATGARGQARAALQSIRAGWWLARASLFVVDDYFFPMYVIQPRPGTRRVQVWHACGAFKQFGYSVLDKAFGVDETFVARRPIHTNYDLCLVSAMRFAPFYAEAFRQPLERFSSSLGIPRTDLLVDPARRAEAAAEVRSRFALPEGRRVVLYAPTFRGERIGRARQPEQLDLGRLREVLGDDHVVLVRAHPFVRAALRLGLELDGFALDASDYPDINALMVVSDVLVTDYSSAMYEFALLERPIAFFAPDHAAYEDERGFYLDYPADLPGPVFETTDALAAHLRAGAFDLDRVRRFRDESFDVADGRSTARFVDEEVVPALA